ncbi:hypothetical protein HG530_014780 [Fusarium avenaceum]|nr:hypothetical protein HG530_014780 [Fusarium avenaceum]
MLACQNALMARFAAGQVCKALGVRLIANPQVVQLAKNAGYDSVFIDLEHSTLSLNDASNLCIAGLNAGITPFVRVPHQCGNGFVQKVLDGGSMGIIFPHVTSAAQGCRSMTGQLPVISLKTFPQPQVISEINTSASTVFVMIENKSAVEKVDEIAAVDGVDVVLVGSNDLAIELGVPGEFRSEVFRGALTAVSKACKKHGKVMGLAGIYDQADIHDWAIHSLGVRFMLCQQDSGLIAGGAVKCLASVQNIENSPSLKHQNGSARGD